MLLGDCLSMAFQSVLTGLTYKLCCIIIDSLRKAALDLHDLVLSVLHRLLDDSSCCYLMRSFVTLATLNRGDLMSFRACCLLTSGMLAV